MSARKDEPQSIEDVLRQFKSNNKIEKGLDNVKLTVLWAELMGPGVQAYTRSVKLVRDTLYVSISSSVLREELNYGKDNIIAMLNEGLKKDCITKLGVNSVVSSGTCFEYGMKSGCLRIDDECNPITSYGLAKHFLHKSLLLLKNDVSFNLAWARLFYISEKEQSPNSIISQLDQAIDQNDRYFKMSGGEQLRDYLKINQVIDDLSNLVAKKSDGTFNICSGKPITVRKLVENRIEKRQSSILLNLGFYPYLKYEPFAFWGHRNVPEK